MPIDVPLYREGVPIGRVVYHTAVGGRGQVATAFVPGDRALERMINDWLSNNPKGIWLSGGAQDPIGQWPDGVLRVLQELSDIEGFEYDASAIPQLEFDPDIVN